MESSMRVGSPTELSNPSVRRLDVLTAKRIKQEIQEGIESVRSKFLLQRRNNDRLQLK